MITIGIVTFNSEKFIYNLLYELLNNELSFEIIIFDNNSKDNTLLENWRPINLLNVEYKIATKAIANRLKNVLPSIISSSQTGFIKNRYIGENIRLLLEILEYVEEKQLPVLHTQKSPILNCPPVQVISVHYYER